MYRKGGKKTYIVFRQLFISSARAGIHCRGMNTPKLYQRKGGSNTREGNHTKLKRKQQIKALIQVRESSLREGFLGLTTAQLQQRMTEGRHPG